MTYRITDASRRTGVGMCALVMDGDELAANQLLRMYVTEAVDNGNSINDALVVLTKSVLGIAVGLAADTNTGPEWFQRVGLGLAARS